MKATRFMLLLLFLFIEGCSTPPTIVSTIRSQHCTQEITPNYEVKAKLCDQETTKKMLSELEKVPNPFQKILNDYGVRIVLFDGDIRDHLPPFEITDDLEGRKGVFSPTTKKILVSHEGQRINDQSLGRELHEYGHAIDLAIADLPETPYTNRTGYRVSDLREFKNIHQIAMKRVWFKLFCMVDDEKSSEEFFAECFARYYHSAKSRELMKKLIPECYNFFKKMEEYFLTVKT